MENRYRYGILSSIEIVRFHSIKVYIFNYVLWKRYGSSMEFFYVIFHSVCNSVYGKQISLWKKNFAMDAMED